MFIEMYPCFSIHVLCSVKARFRKDMRRNMRIAASNIEMSSSHEYVASRAQETFKPFGLSSSFSITQKEETKETYRDTFARSDKDLELLGFESSGLYTKPENYHEIEVAEPETKNDSQGLSAIDMIHVHLLRIILQLAQNLGGKGWESFSKNIASQLNAISDGNPSPTRSEAGFLMLFLRRAPCPPATAAFPQAAA